MNKKICFVCTTWKPINLFMKDQLNYLSKKNNITILANGASNLKKKNFKKRINFVDYNIKRKISFLNDIFSLIFIFFFFKKNKFDVVNSMNPKSGLMAMLAARITNVPIRIHIFTGQVWAQQKTYFNFFLKMIDKLIAFFSTHLITDSFSQKKFLIKNKIAKKKK